MRQKTFNGQIFYIPLTGQIKEKVLFLLLFNSKNISDQIDIYVNIDIKIILKKKTKW